MADGLDLTSLQPLQQQIGQTSGQAASLAEGTPGLLQQLKSNLTSIFAKDNPLIAARGTALQDFLNASSQSRVATLPQNLPTVEGSQLNLSPTQQNAITTARESAALAPLAGLNQIITGIYGNIPQMVQNAAGIYQAQVQAAQLRASQLQQQYENAFQELLQQEKVRQFNIQESRLGGGSKGLDLSSLLNLPGGGQAIGQEDEWEVVSPPPVAIEQRGPGYNYFGRGVQETVSPPLQSLGWGARGLGETIKGWAGGFLNLADQLNVWRQKGGIRQ